MKLKNKLKVKGLINLHLLKYQVYKTFTNSNINQIPIELKQSLKLIYLYNNKKNIVFIGFPYNKTLHNQVNHVFVSKVSFFKKFQKKNFLDDYDLIVFYQTLKQDYNLLKKLNHTSVPLIMFCNNYNLKNKCYIVQNILKNKKLKVFVSFLIFSVLTKKYKLNDDK